MFDGLDGRMRKHGVLPPRLLGQRRVPGGGDQRQDDHQTTGQPEHAAQAVIGGAESGTADQGGERHVDQTHTEQHKDEHHGPRVDRRAPPYRGHEGQQIGDQRQHLFEQAAHQAQHTRDRQDGQHDEVEAGHYCAAMKPLS
ncbi:hypothetical protein G6F57_021336 [Rhizopus arrhizus]|nr:hypothetical protein G6F57_021336 [Rhizopus arrhizus]